MNTALIITIILALIALVIAVKIVKKIAKTIFALLFVLLISGGIFFYFVEKDLEGINVNDSTFLIKSDKDLVAAVKNNELLNETEFKGRIFILDAKNFDDKTSYAKQLQEKLNQNPMKYLIENAKSDPETIAFKYPKLTALLLKFKK